MEMIPNKLDIEIIPGVLEKEWEKIEEKIQKIQPFAKHVHIDLLDGIFAPNKTFFDPAPFKQYTKDMQFELHMMVNNPAQYIEQWAHAGFTRFIGQVEHMEDIAGFLAKGEECGEVGLAVDADTSEEKIVPFLEDMDFAFFMTVKAGFSNQSFIENMLEKVKKIRAQDSLLPIEIDGGVNDKNILLAKQAGATRFVSTGFIFNQGESAETQYNTLCSLVK